MLLTRYSPKHSPGTLKINNLTDKNISQGKSPPITDAGTYNPPAALSRAVIAGDNQRPGDGASRSSQLEKEGLAPSKEGRQGELSPLPLPAFPLAITESLINVCTAL